MKEGMKDFWTAIKNGKFSFCYLFINPIWTLTISMPIENNEKRKFDLDQFRKKTLPWLTWSIAVATLLGVIFAFVQFFIIPFLPAVTCFLPAFVHLYDWPTTKKFVPEKFLPEEGVVLVNVIFLFISSIVVPLLLIVVILNGIKSPYSPAMIAWIMVSFWSAAKLVLNLQLQIYAIESKMQTIQQSPQNEGGNVEWLD